jgi:hypothetical protein
MTSPDLDRLLEVAAEAERLRDAVHRAAVLEEEIARQHDVVSAAPRVRASAAEVAEAVEPVARELEREWVAQGPLMTVWQRAVDLVQLAEAAGADAEAFRADADAARRRLEAARLVTREQRDRLTAQRDRLADAVLAAPLDLDPPPPVADDARPEALRRDALELIGRAADAARAAESAAAAAGERLAAARTELDVIGPSGPLAERLAQVEGELPDEVRLDPDAPPSVAMRLHRAGLRVR